MCPLTTRRNALRKLCIVMCLLFAVGCNAQANGPVGTPPPVEEAAPSPFSESEIKARQAVLDQWIEPAKEIAQKTEDEMAKQLITFVEAHGYLGRPAEPDFELAEPEVAMADPFGFGLVPVTSMDGDFKPRDGMTAAYNYETRRLLLTEGSGYSPLYRGLVLLHELTHASQSFTKDVTKLPDPSHLHPDNEREAYAIEFRLLSSIGGADYKVALADEIARLQREGTFGEDFGFDAPKKYDVRLDSVFGDSKSKRERMLRTTLLFIHGQMKAFEIEYGKDAVRMQNKLMAIIYGYPIPS